MSAAPPMSRVSRWRQRIRCTPSPNASRLSRSIRSRARWKPISGGTDGRFAQAIVETSRQSWAESNLASLTSDTGVTMDEASGDEPGPIPLGVVVSAPVEAAAEDEAPGEDQSEPATGDALTPETRVVVFGDSDFPSNASRRHPRQCQPLCQRHQLAGAAREPDRHPPDRGGGPPGHDDAGSAVVGNGDIRLCAASAGLRGGHFHLVETALVARRCAVE